MKASLIISVYRNTKFLNIVLESLRYQTENDFEIIISEDGESDEMRDFVKSYNFIHPFRHLTQTDDGWRKNRALNRAIIAAKAEQLIFIDGDCVLHPRFIEAHTRDFNPDLINAGKRVMLNESMSQKLIANPKSVTSLQPAMWLALIRPNGMKRIEEGLYIPGLNRFRKLEYLTGCNMSFSRKAIMAINGFDEDYTKPAYGEDTDLVWRFKMAGFKFRSLRNAAVQYHLSHPLSWTDQSENMALGHEKAARREFVCVHGISDHL
ncbi:glycosyltransferase [uncultured Duncaniella sp.]|uniref:glycosyltransferase n=1 Tax=uncultured Duncaniella sp. TaxID=2768039 RepID=UPI0025E04033|nr:glycosyltransferase [uncultured Duncaniella sp.]